MSGESPGVINPQREGPNWMPFSKDIALFRYSLIREAADPELSPRERGQLVRRLAGEDHAGPDGTRVRVSRPTLDRWIRVYRRSGYHGLVPEDRRGVPLTPGHILDAAAVLKRENPGSEVDAVRDVYDDIADAVAIRYRPNGVRAAL